MLPDIPPDHPSADKPPFPSDLAAELSAPLLGGGGLRAGSGAGSACRLPAALSRPGSSSHAFWAREELPSTGGGSARSVSPGSPLRRQSSDDNYQNRRLTQLPAGGMRARAHSDDHSRAYPPLGCRARGRAGLFSRQRSASFECRSANLNDVDTWRRSSSDWREAPSYGATFDLSRISPELAQVAVFVSEEGPHFDEDAMERFNSPIDSRDTRMGSKGVAAAELRIQVRAVLRNQLLDKWANLLIIDPSTSKWISMWDLLGAVSLLTVAVIQPVQTAFGDSELMVFRVLNGAIFLIFFFDMLLQFFIAYPNSEHPDIFVRDPRGIVKRYLRSWFIVDFLSASPVELYYWITGQTGHRSIRVLRLLRLVRLLRLTHLRRLRRRLAVNWGLSNAVVSLMKFMGFTVLWCHWMACLWAGVALSTIWFPSEDTGSWLDHLINTKGVNAESYSTPRAIYGISLYWAIMTFTSIGYGDIIPQSEREYWVASLCMAGMAACWTYIIGQVCSIMTSMQKSTKFKQTMDQLNWIMEDRHCPQELREQLRRYIIETSELKRFEEDKGILQQLSPMLQGKISMHLHQGWIEKVWYLQNIPNKEIIIGISRRLLTMVFAPSEEIYVDRTLFIVRRGLCIRKGRILCNGDVWGEDMVLSNENLRERFFVRSVTYLEVIMLSFADLDQVIDCFPEERAKLRWIQVSIAIKAAFIRIAQGIRHLEEELGVDRSQLTPGQRRRLVVEVLGGTFTGTLSEEGEQDTLQLHIEQCMEQAKQELTCGVINRHIETRPHVGAHPQLDSSVLFAGGGSASRADDVMASNMAVMGDLLQELTMKVDCLLLKDEMQAQEKKRRSLTKKPTLDLRHFADSTAKPDESPPGDGHSVARCSSTAAVKPESATQSDGFSLGRSLSASP